MLILCPVTILGTAGSKRRWQKPSGASSDLSTVMGGIKARFIAAIHNHPPVNPALLRPFAMYGQLRINCHRKPVR